MPAHSVGMSEFDWIARYFAPLVTTERAAGLLDDVAELSSHARIITTDALVEGVHFLPSDPIETVARKLVRVNISDILAKGGVPGEALLTLGWPKGRAEADLAGFAKALGEELDHWGASLIGGDTVTAPGGLFLSLTLTGHIATGEHIIRRSGAKAGDGIWITGKIWRWRAGLGRCCGWAGYSSANALPCAGYSSACPEPPLAGPRNLFNGRFRRFNSRFGENLPCKRCRREGRT